MTTSRSLKPKAAVAGEARALATDVERAERIEEMAVRLGDEAAHLRKSAQQRLNSLKRKK